MTSADVVKGGIVDDEGVVFAADGGRRSTSAVGRAVVADAVRDLDPALAARVEAVTDWRTGYLEPFRAMTALAARDPGAAAAVSAAGLAAVHRRFAFARAGREQPLDDALLGGLAEHARSPALHTASVAGPVRSGPEPLSVPYQGGRLVGEDLLRALDRWVAAGVMEPSAAAALTDVAGRPDWLDLSGTTVVVLGAGAQMAPVTSLLRWGAHVVGVDLPVPAIWRRVLDVVAGSPGRLTVPASRWLPATAPPQEVAEAAGVDVLTRAPEVLGWLDGVVARATAGGERVVLGTYVYADGALHARTAVAIDAITSSLLERHPELGLAFLATPTDAFVVPPEAVEQSRQRYRRRSPVARAGRLGSAGRLFAPNYTESVALPGGRVAGLADVLVPQQGPNYALAKRVQRWRAFAQHAAGRPVSINVAPATRTRSVLRNRVLAAAYTGAHRFGVEVFEPAASSTVMAALLARDLHRGHVPYEHPVELLWDGAVHGGLWRTAYAPRSVLGIAVVAGAVQRAP